MALQTSGAISLDDMHVEAGGSTGTQVSINDSDIIGLISKSSGSQMAFNEWYGASGSLNSAAIPVNYSGGELMLDRYFSYYFQMKGWKGGGSGMGGITVNSSAWESLVDEMAITSHGVSHTYSSATSSGYHGLGLLTSNNPINTNTGVIQGYQYLSYTATGQGNSSNLYRTSQNISVRLPLSAHIYNNNSSPSTNWTSSGLPDNRYGVYHAGTVGNDDERKPRVGFRYYGHNPTFSVTLYTRNNQTTSGWWNSAGSGGSDTGAGANNGGIYFFNFVDFTFPFVNDTSWRYRWANDDGSLATSVGTTGP